MWYANIFGSFHAYLLAHHYGPTNNKTKTKTKSIRFAGIENSNISVSIEKRKCETDDDHLWKEVKWRKKMPCRRRTNMIFYLNFVFVRVDWFTSEGIFHSLIPNLLVNLSISFSLDEANIKTQNIFHTLHNWIVENRINFFHRINSSCILSTIF